jgi:methyl-accepting chemotaxis protein
MAEQSTAATQVTAAVESMRRQTEQTSKALIEQSRAVKDVHGTAQKTAKQIALITRASAGHADGSTRLLSQLRDIRAITERNARAVKETRGGTADLLRHADALAGALRKGAQRPGTNGRG